MIDFKLIIGFTVIAIAVLCHVAINAQEITVFEQPKVITFGIDARDYNEIAKEISESILLSSKIRLGEGKALVLGPVDTDANIYRFDPRTLQEKIQTILINSGKLNASFAVDAITENTAAKARYNILLLEWEKKNTVSPEDLITFGKLADIDYLLFGRVSSFTVIKGETTEVTYTYNWKLGDCSTGLLAWSHERETSKNGPSLPIPEWIVNKRGNSPNYLYQIGYSKGVKDIQEGIRAAERNAQTHFAEQFNSEFLPYESFLIRLSPSQIEVLSVPQGEFQKKGKGGFTSWKLMRVSRKKWEKEKEKRIQAVELWNIAEEKKEKNSYKTVIDKYPLGTQSIFQTEVAFFRLADIEHADGNPMAARLFYEFVRDNSASPAWKGKATLRAEEIIIREEEKAIYLHRKAYKGKSIGIYSAYEINGKITRWSKLESELVSFFSQYHAKEFILDIPLTPSEILNNPSLHIVDKLKRVGATYDYFLVIVARGGINERENTRSPFNHDTQFIGEIKCLVIYDNVIKFEDSYRGISGWNPLGASMSMEVLALHAFKRWKEKFSEQSLVME